MNTSRNPNSWGRLEFYHVLAVIEIPSIDPAFTWLHRSFNQHHLQASSNLDQGINQRGSLSPAPYNNHPQGNSHSPFQADSQWQRVDPVQGVSNSVGQISFRGNPALGNDARSIKTYRLDSVTGEGIWGTVSRHVRLVPISRRWWTSCIVFRHCDAHAAHNIWSLNKTPSFMENVVGENLILHCGVPVYLHN